MSQFISVIIPIPELEKVVQDYRFQFDFFASKGIPAHVTLFSNVDIDKYNKNKVKFNKELKKILKFIKKNKINFKDVKKNKKMAYISIDKNDCNNIDKQKELIFIKNKLKYDDDLHLTLFSGAKNKGFDIFNKMKKKINKNLPKKIKPTKLWVLHINKKINKATLLKIIR